MAAMREGAYDYLQKPFKPDEVILTVRKAEERERLRREVDALRSSLGDRRRRAIWWSPRAAPCASCSSWPAGWRRHNTTVLITGESGTGKELIARAIHRMSPRSERSFTAINCAAIPEQLLESELFGHEKGAFTGATSRPARPASRSPTAARCSSTRSASCRSALQAKLLRVLQEGEIRAARRHASTIKVDVRVLAATNRDLRGDGRGRRVPRGPLLPAQRRARCSMPPLRERPSDVPAARRVSPGRSRQRLGRPRAALTPARWRR